MDELTLERFKKAAQGMKGWMKFLGIMGVIGGALGVLSIVGIIFGALQIWLGVLLVQDANRAGEFAATGNEGALAEWAEKLKTYFLVMGVLTLIGIILTVIALCIYLAAVAFLGVQGGLGELSY